MENLLYHGKGHAIIKRFGEKAIYIETVVFGEIVSIVEVVGSTKKVLYKKKQIISTEDLERLWESTAAESRIRTLDLETNYALAWLAEALEKRDVVLIETYKRVLKELHKQRLMLEI
jgi:hypothetical protein